MGSAASTVRLTREEPMAVPKRKVSKQRKRKRRGAMKAEMPAKPFDRSVEAKIRSRSAMGAFVMNIFVPLRI